MKRILGFQPIEQQIITNCINPQQGLGRKTFIFLESDNNGKLNGRQLKIGTYVSDLAWWLR